MLHTVSAIVLRTIRHGDPTTTAAMPPLRVRSRHANSELDHQAALATVERGDPNSAFIPQTATPLPV